MITDIKTENKYGCNRTISYFWGNNFCFLTSKILILSGYNQHFLVCTRIKKFTFLDNQVKGPWRTPPKRLKIVINTNHLESNLLDMAWNRRFSGIIYQGRREIIGMVYFGKSSTCLDPDGCLVRGSKMMNLFCN